MLKQKRMRIIFLGVILGVFVMGGTAFGFYYNNAAKLVQQYADVAYPNIFIDGVDVSKKTEAEIVSMVDDIFKQYDERQIEITVDGASFEATLSDFDVTYNYDSKKLAADIIAIGKEEKVLKQAHLINDPVKYEYDLSYKFNSDIVSTFVEEIATQVKIDKVEPTYTMENRNKFIVEAGTKGYSLAVEPLVDEIVELLKETSTEKVTVIKSRVIEDQDIDGELLSQVNTKISSYTSVYDVGIERAKNVVLAAKKIDKTLLMPGDEFSYVEKVSPVIASEGYVDATIFLYGKPVDGMGGGICQISSTLYNTMLYAGITATERYNHSLQVGYVPIGQDATMSDSGLDLKFVNTLDYPIYINSYTHNGKLIVEFWSNEEALEGVKYEPKTYVYGDGYKADTTLYGYKDGKEVFKQFLHTSTYRKPVE
ncbi:MAG TPA: vanomycin resistance protein VanB [Firmicutes bacterium]|nr:vanomycin resistance protein VanB [Bacillota bacterium]